MVLSKTIILLLLYIENPQNILKTKNTGQFLENRGKIKYYLSFAIGNEDNKKRVPS